MARPAKFSYDDMLDGALRTVLAAGLAGATVSRIAAEVGAPVGSIYHRFSSREVLLARLWLRTTSQFQDGFLARLGGSDAVTAGRQAALYFVAWCREHPGEARLLLLHHRDDFMGDGWPSEVRDRAAEMTGDLNDGIRRFARRRLGGVSADAQRRATFAVIDIPLAAVRRHLLASEPLPPVLDDLITVAHDAVLRGR